MESNPNTSNIEPRLEDDYFADLINFSNTAVANPVQPEAVNAPVVANVQPAVERDRTIVMSAIPVAHKSAEKDPVTKSRARKLWIAAGACAVAAASLISANQLDIHESNTPSLAAPNDGSDVAPTQQENFRDDLTEFAPGFQAGELLVGKDVNHNNNPAERGSNAFSKKTLKSREDIQAWFASDDPRAKAEVAKLKETFKDNPEALKRALDGSAYVPIQAVPASAIQGNSHFDSKTNAVAIKQGSIIKHGSGDVVWMYVDENGHIVKSAIMRADCANISAEHLYKQPENSTPTTGIKITTSVVTIPKSSTTDVTRPGSSTTVTTGRTSTTLANKDPNKDYNTNPAPSPNQGNGTPGTSGPTATSTPRSTSTTSRSGSSSTTAKPNSPPTTEPAGPCGAACE